MEMRKETGDFGLMAFLKMQAIIPSKIEQIHRGKIRAIYEMPQDEWFSLKEKYHLSEFYRYEQLRTQFRNLSF